MRPRDLLAAGAATLALSLLLPAAAPRAEAEVLNKVVIRVNDRIATLHEYQQRKADLEREMLRPDLSLSERRRLAAELPDRVFSDLFQEALLLSRADQLGVVLTEEEVDNQVARLAEINGFENLAEFHAALAQSGMALRDFREQVRRNARINDVIAREVQSTLGGGEELGRRFYRANPEQFERPRRLRLRELLVLEAAPAEGGGSVAVDPAALARALRAEIAAGRELTELAERYADQGVSVVDLGWVAAGDLAPELQSAVWDLPAGAVSEPVASRGSIHVLRVEEREEAGLRPYNEVAEQAAELARRTAFRDALTEYLQQLEQQAYIRLDPPAEAADWRQAAEPPEEPTAAAEPVAEPAGDAADG
ncbi:MAG TPA: peptidyl-prolyl cis-trans isomerase [Thermoanaerobaculia bacterium]|nr:peptidyl-prolyl cis-trans isomerase [Thermoanaerobaculia bacterium]